MKNLYVGNLPHSTTEAELRQLFESHGQVEKVSMVTDRETGRSRGFAFVEMTDAGEAEKAIAALNGTELGGRALAGEEVARVEAGDVMTIMATRVNRGSLAGKI
jgi:cold-inducible RNA-binding protein